MNYRVYGSRQVHHLDIPNKHDLEYYLSPESRPVGIAHIAAEVAVDVATRTHDACIAVDVSPRRAKPPVIRLAEKSKSAWYLPGRRNLVHPK